MGIRSEQVHAAWWFAVAASLLWILWLLTPILTPFLAGAVLAYILDPAVEWLVQRRASRVVASSLVLLLGFIVLLAVFLVVAPLIREEAATLVKRLPELLDGLDAQVSPWLQDRLGREVHLDFHSLTVALKDWAEATEGLFERLLSSAGTGGIAIISWLGNLILIPVVLFYLLVDWPETVRRVDLFVPRRVHGTVRAIVGEVNAVLSEFLRGQLAVMGLLVAYYAAALALGGLAFALPIAVIAGGLAFVPYLGFGTGLALALLVAVLEPDPPRNLLIVGVVFGCGQLLEGFVLTPWLVGQRIGLHPVAVVFALLAFGHVFGFFGVLLALPASAVLLVGLRHLQEAYLASRFYRDA